ncbi:MAG: hypothetical protein JO182_08585 [Acidobacteriaceae bacterium]|nr:hypothetical protein [Acidobacteriaceae bacterium]MBV9034537.1 hypothetical protein [Acidobacteriaceae bacterium]MBV9224039.1 hypothetical protein [Acidobacteriaceae bacterium]MBV9306514.1 hypothetical protein [Acidobacteriaceae bacterium]MBV9678425.1 hypothetical protein [Acidobacteriaceae bacterium]
MDNRLALFVQAARGPILLITLGFLFAIQQAGIVSFARTWPLILIVIGLTKLIERAVTPQGFVQLPPPPPPGGPLR